MHDYDVVIIGGGAIGLATAYALAKREGNIKVAVLEQSVFYNAAGSSGDLVRMYRTMYTEAYMADLARKSLDLWETLEVDVKQKLRLMTGLLNFGDPKYGAGGPEGTLLDPIKNLDRLHMTYERLNKTQIEQQYPFKHLPDHFEGIFAHDNGCIDVSRTLRALLNFAKDHGTTLLESISVKKIRPPTPPEQTRREWIVEAMTGDGEMFFVADKIVVTCGAYANHVLEPSLGIKLDLDIWEMVASYFSMKPAVDQKPHFKSMWFQFADDVQGKSQLFYGFPAVPWGPPDLGRIAVDTATNRINDPSKRKGNVVNPEDISNTQDFIRDHVRGVDGTVPAFTLSCLQTNVYDNMFVLDFIPDKYLHGRKPKSISVFTAGWAMKFIPLLGTALAEMVVDGDSKYKLEQFSINRRDPHSGRGVISDPAVEPLADFLSTANNSSSSGMIRSDGSSRSRLGH